MFCLFKPFGSFKLQKSLFSSVLPFIQHLLSRTFILLTYSVQFSLLLLFSVILNLFFFFIFMVQALKNIAAISLAISYPNKSTQLLNMSPWELHSQEEGSAYRSREDGGGHVLTQLVDFDHADGREPSQNSQCFHFTPILLCHRGQGTQEALSTLTLSPFCLIRESSVLCNSIHLNRNSSEVLFFFKFGFYLKRLG